MTVETLESGASAPAPSGSRETAPAPAGGKPADWTVDQLIKDVARSTASRFRGWVDYEDVHSELALYVLDSGANDVRRMVAAGDRTRLLRALYGAARRFAETEKAERSGYSFEDVAWYRPDMLADLIPMALDPQFDGVARGIDEHSGANRRDAATGGSLLAMVLDTRWALSRLRMFGPVSDYDPETEAGWGRLERLADFLGGEYPGAPGYRRGSGRKAISNATAQHLIRQGTGE